MRKVSCESFEQNTNFASMPIKGKQLTNTATIVPQLSKYLKFEVIEGDKGFVFEQKDIVRLVPVLLIKE